jgi:hypothetical protein
LRHITFANLFKIKPEFKMKKLFAIIAVAGVMASCAGKKDEPKAEGTTPGTEQGTAPAAGDTSKKEEVAPVTGDTSKKAEVAPVAGDTSKKAEAPAEKK